MYRHGQAHRIQRQNLAIRPPFPRKNWQTPPVWRIGTRIRGGKILGVFKEFPGEFREFLGFFDLRSVPSVYQMIIS